MWYENDPKIINAKLLEGIETGIMFDHKYMQPISPSKRKFRRDFVVECEDSFDIVGIDHHYYRNCLYSFGEKFYNGQTLDLEYEPWNEYDPNAIVVRMLGCKLGYITRYDTEVVSWIMTCCKNYWATLDCSFMCFEKVNISYLQTFHDTYTLPYQTDMILTASHSAIKYDRYVDFFRRITGHAITFEESERNNLILLRTDMRSIIGYINDTFILKLCKKKHHVAGFIEEVCCDDESKAIEIKLRLLMEKSVINKNYLLTYNALKKFFSSFNDAGTYSIEWTDLVKIVPRKSRSLPAYDPLMKYLKENHAIQLTILNAPKEVDKVRYSGDHGSKTFDAVAVKHLSTTVKQDNNSNSRLTNLTKTTKRSLTSISEFFPLWGITIGRTTWAQAKEKGYKVEIWEKGPGRVMSIGCFDFWDHKGSGVFTSASLLYSSSYFPPKWKSKGLSWNRSYDGWIKVFKNLRYEITVKDQPSIKEFQGRKTLSASFEALSPDSLLLFTLNFDHGENGYLTSSPKTLFFINVAYQGA